LQKSTYENRKPRKKGLLISPEYPFDSFWGYRYIMSFINNKTAYPPLGLLTFAAYMPDNWDFELVDLNVKRISKKKLREMIEEADAVFVGAMSIQKKSLVELLEGPANGTETPWVLGGPLASTYRDIILNPKTESDKVLHDGLSILVWGEVPDRIDDINIILEEKSKRTADKPILLIPQQVVEAEPGSHSYINDRRIFKPLVDVPPPRWDLINVANYRSIMIQTTIGCPFRCKFCDIIMFNGGFSRPKDRHSIIRELHAIYNTGHRGSVFTVDDNFIGSINDISLILNDIIDFQRKHNYPFEFITQASVDIGEEKNEYIIEKMKSAGFSAVFIGIENPDPKALKAMNKKQNNKVDMQETIQKIQGYGIEVYAGFIFGCDGDTPSTANKIVDFVKKTNIFSAMTGMLTPLPHTKTYQELEEQGRLLPAEFNGNNLDDEIRFIPKSMTISEMREGINRILTDLFNPKEAYRRALGVLENTTPHIFMCKNFQVSYIKAAVLSLWHQGIKRFDPHYFNLLKEALKLDMGKYRNAKKELNEIYRLWERHISRMSDAIDLDDLKVKSFSHMIDYAREYMIRFKPDISLKLINDYYNSLKESLTKGDISTEDAKIIYNDARMFLRTRMKQFTFPGFHLERSFELAIKALHYEKVAYAVVSKR